MMPGSLRRLRFWLPLGLGLIHAASGLLADDAAKVDFDKQIRPLFVEHCHDCHGPDTREAGLRLDRRNAALAGGDSGRVIVPGQPEASLLLDLISGNDADRVMPPDGDTLTAEQLELVRRWIAQGAHWPEDTDPEQKPDHWAYQPLRSPVVPRGVSGPAVIDTLVRQRLAEAAIAPSPAADRYTLIRRLYADLLGLLPEPEEVERFIHDESPNAYEALVDRLLASPHFGERWGRHWLDAARYADSDGYEKDNPRYNAWKYRDWVIDAINRDLPFDQFTIEQIAGDLLPDATPEQRLATAFNRQTLTNTEGGTDQEEFRVEATFDRVETLGTVWLGLTVGCARCHSHKYDAITQREYFQLFAFFNNADESNLDIPTTHDAWEQYQREQAAWESRLAELQRPLNEARERIRPDYDAWLAETSRLVQTAADAQSVDLDFTTVKAESENTLTRQPDGSWLASSLPAATDIYELTFRIPAPEDERPFTGLRLEVLTDPSLPRNGPGRSSGGNFVLSEIALLRGTSDQAATLPHVPVPFASAVADFSQGKYDVAQAIDGIGAKSGWAVSPQTGKPHWAKFRLEQPVSAADVANSLWTVRLIQEYGSDGSQPHPIGRFRLRALFGDDPSDLNLPEEIRTALQAGPDQRTPAQEEKLFDYYASTREEIRPLQAALDQHKARVPFKPVMTVAVMSERDRNRRETRILKRGNFLEPLGNVSPGPLEVLHEMTVDPSATRLDLARWLVSPENPLTPRVTVNHIWMHLFGVGLVKTVNDFGVRGDRPSHPELLDWLAAEFLRVGWSRKQLIRTIVLSETYRQSAQHRPELDEIDPQNRLLWRQNRFRVEAEIIRDFCLDAPGLLDDRVGGPSVFPPLPPGIAELSYANRFKWGASDWNTRPDRPGGVAPKDDHYRRGMYTFFKRTAAHPNLVNFDCPDSNTTCVERRRSNTPLQALQILNNDVFVTAAQAMARRMLDTDGTDDERLELLFRRCLVRFPTSDEQAALRQLLDDALAWYADHPEQAVTFGGEATTELAVRKAAWTTVARTVMNLDEFLTRE